MKNSVRFFPHWNPDSPQQVIGLLQLVVDIRNSIGSAAIAWAEVGSFLGESATLVLPHVRLLWCVEHSKQHAESLRRRFEPFRGVTVVNQTSLDAAEMFQDGFLDVVYIDADHKYEAVSADIKAWSPKVRRGGFICGHDFHAGFPGVMQAVRESLGEPDVYCDSSWLWRVP